MRLNPQPFHAVDMTTDGENDTGGKERERMAASMALSRTSNFAPPPGVLHGASLIREIREIRGRSWERSRLSPPPWLRAPPRPHSLSLPWSGRVPPRPRSALSPQVDCAGPSQRLRSPPGAPSKSFLSAAAESRSIPIHRGSWLPETPERAGADAEVANIAMYERFLKKSYLWMLGPYLNTFSLARAIIWLRSNAGAAAHDRGRIER